MIGYDVVNLGERELAGGVEELRRLIEKSRMVFTSASFVYRDNGEQLFAPYAIRDYKLASGRSVRIGFLGVNTFNSAFARETPDRRVLIMRDPVEAVKLHLPALRAKVDLVVLLANLSLRDLTTLLAGSKGIDLALASYGARFSPAGTIEMIEGVPVLYSGDQGKRMGEVRLKFERKGVPPKLTANHVFLTRRYPSDPKLQDLIDRTIARVNEINRQKAVTAVAAPAPPVAARGPAGTGATVPLETVSSAPADGKGFLTANACVSCHSEAYEVYARTKHARAFDTLVKANQDYNPECVKCHVTGYEAPNGFINARQSPELVNVQCEACHGNATEHLRDASKPFGNVPPRSCFTCHTKENSPDFAFFKYWDMIKH
ncbi:MAG TPA: multiheme c-type cytochrome [Candidatus Polarisedimenticolia bacterium]